MKSLKIGIASYKDMKARTAFSCIRAAVVEILGVPVDVVSRRLWWMTISRLVTRVCGAAASWHVRADAGPDGRYGPSTTPR